MEKKKLKDIIVNEVFVQNKDEQIEFSDNPDTWLFDFRRVIMRGDVGNVIAALFLETFKDRYPFQIGTIEIAGVPLMTSIVTTMFGQGYTDINGFFVRKSRKKSGLFRMIEGAVLPDVPIILVDDLMNGGNSFWRQVEALEALGHKVDTVWAILRFRDLDFYKRFRNRNIEVRSVFELNDFTDVLGAEVKNLIITPQEPPRMPFEATWAFQSPNPALGHVVSKSDPILDDTRLYVGSDDRTFWALNQEDGSVAWSYRVGAHTQKKSIFSSPALYKDTVLFGSYDGNLYSLDRETGKRVWMFSGADWIGSSPAVAHDLKLVFIGLELGLLGRRGGIVAVDAERGTSVWSAFHPALTHATPRYLTEHRQVAIGSNDFGVRLYDARTGTLLWTFTTFGGADYDSVKDGGFGRGDIKESIAYDSAHDYLIFGSIDSFLYVVDRKTGHLVKHFKCEFGIIGTPFVYDGKAYFTSLDRHVRCLNLNTFELIFEVNPDYTRIFCAPTIIDGKLYVGTNAGRLHEMDPETGEQLGHFQATERITNPPVYNPVTKRFFLPTYANQIIHLDRKRDVKKT